MTMMMTKLPRVTVGVCLVLGAGAAACEDNQPLGSGDYVATVDMMPEPIEALDILFVIDDSGSMEPHQDALIDAARDQLFAQLEQELGGLPDLHVGVVTTDMEANADVCSPVLPYGLLRDGANGGPSCAALPEPWIVDVDDGAGGRTRNYQGALSDAFGCIARVGVQGCGFEQPFAAMQRALDGSHPEHEGFVREDAMLLVVFVTDEDDCSASPALFEPETSELLGPLASFRCFEFGVVCDEEPRVAGAKTNCVPREDSPYVSPVAGFVDFLNGVKSDPSMVMVAGLYGPADVVAVQPGVEDTLELADVCGIPDDAGLGFVAPAVRMAALAESFPARYELGDICEAVPSELARIATTVGGAMSLSPCLVGEVADRDPAAAGIQTTCRAWDIIDARLPTEQRVAVPACDGDSTGASCFTVELDADACPGTRSQLLARRDGVRPADTHFVVECLR